jgi:fructose-1,6-bisphosphatase/inositol monophosphatase family enzyme
MNIKKITLSVLSKFKESKYIDCTGDDLKGEHHADEEVINELQHYFTTENTKYNVFFEGGIVVQNNASKSLLIDPVDGSINRDLYVGDPGIVVAYAHTNTPAFKDIIGGFVYGIHSNDSYFSIGNKSYLNEKGCTNWEEIYCNNKVTRLEDAILYYNDGYGKEYAKSSYKKTGSLPLFVKHRNAFDNTALELCQMSRGAAHVRVESRSYTKNGKLKGSDHANIITAFAIGKAAGLITVDLNGNCFKHEKINLDDVKDFICCSNKLLLQEVLSVIENNQQILMNEMA